MENQEPRNKKRIREFYKADLDKEATIMFYSVLQQLLPDMNALHEGNENIERELAEVSKAIKEMQETTKITELIIARMKQKKNYNCETKDVGVQFPPKV